jgi:hypothetical protein
MHQCLGFHDAGDSVIQAEGGDLNGKAQRLPTMMIGQFLNCLEYALNFVCFSANAYSTYIVSLHGVWAEWQLDHRCHSTVAPRQPEGICGNVSN